MFFVNYRVMVKAPCTSSCPSPRSSCTRPRTQASRSRRSLLNPKSISLSFWSSVKPMLSGLRFLCRTMLLLMAEPFK